MFAMFQKIKSASKPCTNCSTRWLRVGDRVFEMCEKNSSRQASVRERYFHLGARDRKVVREPESGGRALLPCPMAHATRHARAVSRARAIAARTPKSFPALVRFRVGFVSVSWRVFTERGANKRPRAIASTGSCDDGGVPSRRTPPPPVAAAVIRARAYATPLHTHPF